MKKPKDCQLKDHYRSGLTILKLFDHVSPFKTVPKFPVIFAHAYAAYDGNLFIAVFAAYFFGFFYHAPPEPDVLGRAFTPAGNLDLLAVSVDFTDQGGAFQFFNEMRPAA